MLKIIPFIFFFYLYSFQISGQITLNLTAIKDNTVADITPDRSNGEGDYFFTGKTSDGKIFRAFIQYDISSIPEEATITQADLILNMSRTTTGNRDVSIHVVTGDWGEGTSDAPNQEGNLADATTDDVTWNDRFFGSSSAWMEPGGDYNSTASASTSVGATGVYTWSSATMISDINNWRSNPSINFGWIIIGEEGGITSSKRFDSKDNPNSANHPKLAITYELPNEIPVISDTIFSLDENSPNGTIVGSVSASDPDSDELSFSISSGNIDDAFSISSTSGEISVNNSIAIDFETNPVFMIMVEVNDGRGGQDTGTITININDLDESNTAPQISDSDYTINEHTETGTIIDTLNVTDPDGDQVTFSIISGNIGDAFLVDEATGILVVQNSAALDFETVPVFILVIRVDDGKGGIASATITINLVDVVESNGPPVIQPDSIEIKENSPSGEVIYIIEAEDPDGDTLIYSIIDGNEMQAFYANESTGQIIINDSSVIDYEKQQNFNLTVSADDGHGNMATALLMISVIDVRDTNVPPVISDQLFEIDENSMVNTLVGQVIASDEDGDSLFFSILEGNSSETFRIDRMTGDLYINDSTEIDYEKNRQYILIVSVEDGYGGTSNGRITVNINDIRDTNSPPVITDQSFEIPENSPVDTRVGRIIANDEDGDSLYFSILDGNINEAFRIDSISGEIFINDSSEIDFEKREVFTLIMEVKDNYDGKVMGDVEIRILDVEEEEPLGFSGKRTDSEISIFPNPAKEKIRLRMPFQSSDNISIYIYDITGVEKIILFKGNVSFGRYPEFDISTIQPGIYILRVHMNNREYNERLSIR